MKKTLGYRAKGRKIISADDAFELREAIAPFGNADNLDSGNTYYGINPSTGSGSIDSHHP